MRGSTSNSTTSRIGWRPGRSAGTTSSRRAPPRTSCAARSSPRGRGPLRHGGDAPRGAAHPRGAAPGLAPDDAPARRAGHERDRPRRPRAVPPGGRGGQGRGGDHPRRALRGPPGGHPHGPRRGGHRPGRRTAGPRPGPAADPGPPRAPRAGLGPAPPHRALQGDHRRDRRARPDRLRPRLRLRLLVLLDRPDVEPSLSTAPRRAPRGRGRGPARHACGPASVPLPRHLRRAPRSRGGVLRDPAGARRRRPVGGAGPCGSPRRRPARTHGTRRLRPRAPRHRVRVPGDPARPPEGHGRRHRSDARGRRLRLRRRDAHPLDDPGAAGRE